MNLEGSTFDDIMGQEAEINKNQGVDKYGLYAKIKSDVSALEYQVKEKKAQLENLKSDIIDEMSSEGVKTKKFEDGPTFTVVEKKVFSCKKANRESLVDWALDNGYKEGLNIHYQSLQAICKDRIESEDEIPEFIEVYEDKNLSLRK